MPVSKKRKPKSKKMGKAAPRADPYSPLRMTVQAMSDGSVHVHPSHGYTTWRDAFMNLSFSQKFDLIAKSLAAAGEPEHAPLWVCDAEDGIQYSIFQLMLMDVEDGQAFVRHCVERPDEWRDRLLIAAPCRPLRPADSMVGLAVSMAALVRDEGIELDDDGGMVGHFVSLAAALVGEAGFELDERAIIEAGCDRELTIDLVGQTMARVHAFELTRDTAQAGGEPQEAAPTPPGGSL